MDSKFYDLFCVTNNNIPEDLFKQKIGTGDFLEQLIQNGSVIRTDLGIKASDTIYLEVSKNISPNRKKELHIDIINSYYLPKICEIKIVDYNDFVKSYILYINLILHYYEISEYDKAIEQLFPIAKKMYYWGMEKEVLELINKFSDEQLNQKNTFYKLYYYLFCNILSMTSEDIEYKGLVNKFLVIEEVKSIDFHLYLEMKNLEAIFYRKIPDSLSIAMKIYLNILDELNEPIISDFSYFATLGRIYLNLCFCYEYFDKEIAMGYLSLANKYLKKTDEPYEMAKFHYLSAQLLFNSNEDFPLFLESINELRSYLEKYAFPDIERNLFNLLSMVELQKNNRIDNSLKLKTRALACDLVLNDNFLISDFLDIYNIMLQHKDEYKKEISEVINEITDVLNESNFEDEILFMRAIKAFLQGDEYKDIKDKISNISLVKLFDEFVS